MAVQQAVRLRSNELYTGGATGLATSYYKIEFDAPFDLVQWLVGSKVATGTPGTFKVQFAVTDEIATDTATKAYLPMRAGVAYNDLSANGWKNATFGGAASKQIGLAPSTDGKSVIHMSTDVMSLASVPRADGKPGGILLVKVVQADTATTAAFTQESSSNSAWGGARGTKPWFREFFCTKRANVDGIATLTSLPTSATEGSTGYAIMGFPIVNAIGSVNPELVMFTGDSRKSAAWSSFLLNNPNRQALMSLSTPGRPISVVNAAGSGHGQSEYLQVARDMITAGLRPSIIYQPGFSQNGFVDFATLKTKNDEFMAWVRAVPGMENVKFVMDTDYYTSGYNGNKETWRQQCIAYAKSLANGSTVFCFDSDPIITDYSTPSAPVLRPTLMQASENPPVHANQLGQDHLTYGAGANTGLAALYANVLNSTAVVVPGAPAIGVASAGTKFATVAGTAPASTGGGAITGYRATSTPGGIVGTSSTLPVPVTGLADNTAYTFSLAAQTAAGYGPESLASNSVTTAAAGDTTAPVMFGEIEITNVTTSGATLSCAAATDAVGVAGYEYSIDGGTSYTVIPNAARSVAVTGRPAATLHEARMRAFDAAGNRSQQPLAKSFTTLAAQPAQNAVVAKTVAESRRVAFPGGTRVVAFGTVPSAVTPNAPYLEAGRWWSEKHPLDERYWVADITIDLDERATTATSVERIVAGVTVLEEPVIQGKLIPVKLGGFNAATGAINYCTFRVTCANGERFDRTIWFKQPVGAWWINKDADDQSYYVADIGNDLIDSGTTATAVKAFPVGVVELVPAVIQGPLILVKLGGMDSLPAGVNYCDFRIDCANGERFYRSMQFNRVDN
jgi:hypothetical protein